MSLSIPPPSPMPADNPGFIGVVKGLDPRKDLALTVRTTVILGAVLLAVWALSDIVLLIFFAVLIGAMLRGLADVLTSLTGLRTGLTLAIVTVLLVVGIVALGWWAGPLFVAQGKQLWSQVSGQLSNVQGKLGGLFGSSAVATANGQGGVPAVRQLTSLVPKVASSTLGFIGGLLVL